MGTSYTSSYEAYRGYILAERSGALEQEIADSRADLLDDMQYSPDYHPDTKRNGVVQPLLLTRGGDENTYNVICRPGDQLYAGDIIDAFGEKYIVMEARADDTTHKTGLMHQCNHFFRWQNFSPEIYETWCYVRASGYSAYLGSNTKLQKSDEQMVIYLPYTEASSMIFVDKRLPSHIGYDKHGDKLLSAFRVTGTNPVSPSYNRGDHMLLLKVERDVFGAKSDNLELQICDYIDGEATGFGEGASESSDGCPCCSAKEDLTGVLAGIRVVGRPSVKIGRSSTYQAVSVDGNGADMSARVTVSWELEGPDGVACEPEGNSAKITVVKDDALIGETFTLSAVSGDISAHVEVEVDSLV